MSKGIGIVILSLGMLSAPACRKSQKPESVPPRVTSHPETPQSERLAKQFPLLPMIEKHLWQKLLEAEQQSNQPEASEEALAEIQSIVEQLQTRHPFFRDEVSTTLGGIRYDHVTRQISLIAEVDYPETSDPRHPGELELILCTARGRTHETLFVTEARPLHLEALLRMADFRNERPRSRFSISISIPNQPHIPISRLIRSTDGAALPQPLVWEFSGSRSSDPYLPDQTGDLMICWHAHDAVLRIKNPSIAHGEMHLRAQKHPELEQGMKVKVIITPLGY